MLRAAAVLLTALSATVPAQDAPVRFVDGRPMLRVTLRAGEASYPCHVLVDLTRREPLHLHDNAAQSLGALQCEVSVDGSDLVFRDMPVDGSRDSWLEGFTKDHAEELQEVPVAGFLGVGAFQGRTIVLDGPAAKLRVLASGSDRPPEAAGRGSSDLAADPGKRGVTWHVQFAAEGEAGTPDTRGVVALHTKEGASMIGRMRVRLSVMEARFEDPAWYPLRVPGSDVCAGELLIGFQLISSEVSHVSPAPALQPRQKSFDLDVTIVGARQLQDTAAILLTGVRKSLVKWELNDYEGKTPLADGENPNYLMSGGKQCYTILVENIKLPVDALYAPSITFSVHTEGAPCIAYPHS